MATTTKKKKRNRKNRGIVLIKKSNQLIESRYKFDVWETRIFLSVLSNIHMNDDDFKKYRIWYRDIIKTFNINSGQSYNLLREAAKSLMRKVFNVSSIDNGFERETEYHIIRSVNYLSENEKSSNVDNQEYIDITIEPEMKPLLLQLQRNFTAYDLKNVVKLSSYGLRFYELLKQYEGLINKRTGVGERTLEFEEMKRMFELTSEYPKFSNFNQKVIQPAINGINKYTDLEVIGMDKIKKGRRIAAVRFRFMKKEDRELLNKEAGEKNGGAENNRSSSLLKDELFLEFQSIVVGKFGVTPSVFLNLLEGKKREEVEKAIRVTNRAKANGQVTKNVPGYFVRALKEGYTDQKEETTKRKMEREKVLEKMQQLKGAQIKAVNDRIKDLTSKDPTLTDRAIVELRNNIMTKDTIQTKETMLGRELVVEDFRKDVELREMVKKAIYQMAKEDFKELDAHYVAEFAKLKALMS